MGAYVITADSIPLLKNGMNKPNYEVKLMPQLEKACGLDLHKDKIVAFVSDKDGKEQQLYKLVPEEVKQYALYRTLTGEAIKMLKEGMEADVITESLKKKYIDPLLDAPKKNSKNKTVEEPVTRDRVKGMTDLTSYPQIPSGARRLTRTRRSFLLQKITEGQSPTGYFSSGGADPILQISRMVSESPFSDPEPTEKRKPRTKTTNGLIYVGRLPECKKLKIWLRPVDSAV